jgi:hypothetical protein
VRAAVGDRRCARWSAAVSACRRLTDGGGGGRRGLDASEAEAAGMASEEASAWLQRWRRRRHGRRRSAEAAWEEAPAAHRWEGRTWTRVRVPRCLGGGGGAGMGGGGRRRRHGRRHRWLINRKAEHGLGLGFLDASEVEAASTVGGGAGMGGGGRRRRHGRRHQLLTDGKAEHDATI